MAANQDFTGFNSQADALYNSEKLSKVLQILYTQSTFLQISEEHKEYEMIKKKKASNQNARSVNFMLKLNYGASAVGASGTGEFKFKDQDQSLLEEKAAVFKQKTSTIGISYSLLKRAKTAPVFSNPFKEEVESKSVIQKRLMASEVHRDGSAVIGVVSAHTTGAADSEIEVTFTSDSNGNERHVEYGDKLVIKASADGSDSVSGLVVTVTDKVRETNTIKGTISAAVAADELDGGVVFRQADTTDFVGNADFKACLDANASGAGVAIDQVSLNLVGFESLYSADGRKVHEITMSGITAGTEYDNAGALIDLDSLYGALDKVKIRNGRSAAKWTQLLAANETLRSIIDGQETDRRLVSPTDNSRGFSGFSYVHDNSKLEMGTTEYVFADRIWSMPEGEGVCEMWGKDFEEVEIGGQREFMALSGGERVAGMRKYFCGYCTYLSRRPSLVLKIKNFTV